MPVSKTSGPNRPNLLIKEIGDIYSRRNFQELFDFFQAEDQVLGYKFFDRTFTEAQTNFKIAHGLNTIPQDIVVSQITGVGTVTFNLPLFDRVNLDLTITGACRIRFLVGVNRNGENNPPLGSMTFYSSAPEDDGTINGADITPGTVGTTQLSDGAVTEAKLAAGIATPSGVISSFGGTTAPTGWLLCDGTEVSRTTYAALFATIGVAYGSGDGTTTFNVPELRGSFLRGRDGGLGRDPDAGARTFSKPGGNTGDNVGSIQFDAFQGHRHNSGIPYNLSGSRFGTVAGQTNVGRFAYEGIANTVGLITGDPRTGLSGTIRTSTETRPTNVYVNFIIKT